MSETVALPELDVTDQDRARVRGKGWSDSSNAFAKLCIIECRERQLRAAIAAKELAEARLEAEAWVSVENGITHVQHNGPRVESGPIRFGDDWIGLFLRGDNALYYSFVLNQCLGNPAFLTAYGAVLRGFAKQLAKVDMRPSPPEAPTKEQA